MRYLEIDARVENLQAVQQFVETEIDGFDIPFKTIAQINIAVEEIFVNIASHGYGGTGGYFRIGVGQADGILCVEFADKAPPFDPLKASVDTVSALEDRKIGGLGIYMVKKSMDSVDYRFENNQNILFLHKKLS